MTTSHDGWTAAPGDSHLEAFRLDDPQGGGEAVLRVRFKATVKKPMTEYAYRLPSPADARRVFELMTGHPDPGKVVHAELVRAGVPYERVS